MHQQGNLDQAKSIYEEVLSQAPTHAEAKHLLGVCHHQSGENPAAAKHIESALTLDPGNVAFLYNLGVVYQELGHDDGAAKCYFAVLESQPANLAALVNLGNLHFKRGVFSEALHLYRQALRLEPGSADHHLRVARSLRNIGNSVDALGHLGTASLLAPEDEAVQSEVLFTSQYVPGINLPDLSRRHQEWWNRFSSGPEPIAPPELARKAAPPYRVGFLSPDLGNHPVGIFLAPLLERLRKNKEVEVFCFNDRKTDDEFSRRLRDASDHWHDCAGMGDEALLELLHREQLHVLIELAGHTENNRLPLLATRVAPAQATWAGYVGTTGSEMIDYLITDPFHTPDGTEDFFSETLLRFPHGYIGYEPPSYAPEVGALPFLENGYPTFGCLNNPSKLSHSTIQLWSEILRRLPESRLILKYKGMDDRAVRERVLGLFRIDGVSPDRVEMIGQTNHVEHLSLLNRIDIALDPTPYSGGLSTCEAMWMGVPVVTCPGDTFASRHSLSHLTNAGFTDMITDSFPAYVEKACTLASDADALATIRAGMRERMSNSPLCDLDGFAEDFVSALEAIVGHAG